MRVDFLVVSAVVALVSSPAARGDAYSETYCGGYIQSPVVQTWTCNPPGSGTATISESAKGGHLWFGASFSMEAENFMFDPALAPEPLLWWEPGARGGYNDWIGFYFSEYSSILVKFYFHVTGSISITPGFYDPEQTPDVFRAVFRYPDGSEGGHGLMMWTPGDAIDWVIESQRVIYHDAEPVNIGASISASMMLWPWYETATGYPTMNGSAHADFSHTVEQTVRIFTPDGQTDITDQVYMLTRDGEVNPFGVGAPNPPGAVPEPSTVALLMTGLGALIWGRRRMSA